MRAGIGEISFDTHADAVGALSTALSPWFDLCYEVELGSSQIDGSILRADLVAIDKDRPDRVIGFEVKRGFYRMSEYSHAIKQAADYRLATLSGLKHGLSPGRRVGALFVFPRWYGGHDRCKEYAEQALGMEILSHHFRVGFAAFCAGSVTLTMNNRKLWDKGTWSKAASEILIAKDRVGSQKIRDPLKSAL